KTLGLEDTFEGSCVYYFAWSLGDLSYALPPGVRARGPGQSTPAPAARDLWRQPWRIGTAHLDVGPEFGGDGHHRHLSPASSPIPLSAAPRDWAHGCGPALQHAGPQLLLASSSTDAARIWGEPDQSGEHDGRRHCDSAYRARQGEQSPRVCCHCWLYPQS